MAEREKQYSTIMGQKFPQQQGYGSFEALAGTHPLQQVQDHCEGIPSPCLSPPQDLKKS